MERRAEQLQSMTSSLVHSFLTSILKYGAERQPSLCTIFAAAEEQIQKVGADTNKAYKYLNNFILSINVYLLYLAHIIFFFKQLLGLSQLYQMLVRQIISLTFLCKK